MKCSFRYCNKTNKRINDKKPYEHPTFNFVYFNFVNVMLLNKHTAPMKLRKSKKRRKICFLIWNETIRCAFYLKLQLRIKMRIHSFQDFVVMLRSENMNRKLEQPWENVLQV